MKTIVLSNTATNLNPSVTPFAIGFNAVAVNLTASPVVIEGSADNTNWTTLASLSASTGTTAVQNIPALPKYVRLQAAGTAFLFSSD